MIDMKLGAVFAMAMHWYGNSIRWKEKYNGRKVKFRSVLYAPAQCSRLKRGEKKNARMLESENCFCLRQKDK